MVSFSNDIALNLVGVLLLESLLHPKNIVWMSLHRHHESHAHMHPRTNVFYFLPWSIWNYDTYMKYISISKDIHDKIEPTYPPSYNHSLHSSTLIAKIPKHGIKPVPHLLPPHPTTSLHCIMKSPTSTHSTTHLFTYTTRMVFLHHTLKEMATSYDPKHSLIHYKLYLC